MNPLGKMVNEYLMKMALPLGGFFIVEYLVRNAATTNVLMGLLVYPMMIVTPVALWWILKNLRQKLLSNMMLGIQAWSFGTQLMFFAGLIEAMFIYVYNQFLAPTNLLEVQQAAIVQYEEAYNLIKGMGTMKQLEPYLLDSLQTMRESSVPSAIEAAISALSSDIFIGMFLMIPIAFIVRKKSE